jgi:dihydrofolate reductase
MILRLRPHLDMLRKISPAGSQTNSLFCAILGKNIWMMGGASIIASFLDEGQIDEFMIHVIPKLIGEGVPLIAPTRRTVPLKLLPCTKFADGVVKFHYAV